MALNPQNLTPIQPGQILNPNGRPKGVPNRKTILNKLLFELDIDEAGIITKKPDWWDKLKPKTAYELTTLAQIIKAASGDTQAYNAINKALGEVLNVNDGEAIEVVHIFKPEKLSEDALEQQAMLLRKRAERTVEAEVIDDGLDSPSRPTDLRTINT